VAAPACRRELWRAVASNAPGDQPSDLIVPGRGPVEATVIAVDGLAVTVSVAEDPYDDPKGLGIPDPRPAGHGHSSCW